MKSLPSLASVFLLVLIFIGCSFQKYKVRYEAQCTKCTVSYLKEKDINIERQPLQGTWSYEFLGYEGQQLSVAAANVDTLQDKVFVAIYLNGVLQDSLSKSGKKWSAASIKYTIN
jgi:hypothetical protein